MDIKPVENTYKGGFFKNRNRLMWRAPIVVEALVETFGLTKDQLVVDVGCAIGDYVEEFSRQGYYSCGIEGSVAAKEFLVSKQVYFWDLRIPFEPNLMRNLKAKRFDLAFSLEVAEHIDPFHSGIYCDNLCALSNTILISAATPGQKGHGHVNCAPRKYWIDKMARRGYTNMKGLEHQWRSALVNYRTKKELSSYIKNAIVFRRKDAKG